MNAENLNDKFSSVTILNLFFAILMAGCKQPAQISKQEFEGRNQSVQTSYRKSNELSPEKPLVDDPRESHQRTSNLDNTSNSETVYSTPLVTANRPKSDQIAGVESSASNSTSASSQGTTTIPTFPTVGTPKIKGLVLQTQTNQFALIDRIEISWDGIEDGALFLLAVSSSSQPDFAPKNGQIYIAGQMGDVNILSFGSEKKYVYGGNGRIASKLYFFLWAVTAQKIYSTKPEIVSFTPCSALDGGQWLAIAGEQTYGTTGFCVQKYLASQVDTRPNSQPMMPPWVDIDWNAAKQACQKLGVGYHLLTNSEWMTIALSIISSGANWSSGIVGNGTLSRGHSDGSPNIPCPANVSDGLPYVENTCDGLATGNFRQKRIRYLPHNQVIWDFGGNLWQWVDYTNLRDKPEPTGRTELKEIRESKSTLKSHVVPLNSVTGFWQDTWDSDEGIGMAIIGPQGLGGTLVRGGQKSDDLLAGPLSFNLTYGPQTQLPFIGFRCAYDGFARHSQP